MATVAQNRAALPFNMLNITHNISSMLLHSRPPDKYRVVKTSSTRDVYFEFAGQSNLVSLPDSLVDSNGLGAVSKFVKATWREHQVQSILWLANGASQAQQLLLSKQKMLRAIMEVQMCQVALQDLTRSGSPSTSDPATSGGLEEFLSLSEEEEEEGEEEDNFESN